MTLYFKFFWYFSSCAVITVTKNAVITVTSGHDDVGSKETNMLITSTAQGASSNFCIHGRPVNYYK